MASALRTGLTADCTDLHIGDHRLKGEEYKNLLYQIRPAFGGNIIATIINPLHRPQMATVREGVMVMPDGGPAARRAHHRRARHAHAGAIAVREGVELSDVDFAVKLIEARAGGEARGPQGRAHHRRRRRRRRLREDFKLI